MSSHAVYNLFTVSKWWEVSPKLPSIINIRRSIGTTCTTWYTIHYRQLHLTLIIPLDFLQIINMINYVEYAQESNT